MGELELGVPCEHSAQGGREAGNDEARRPVSGDHARSGQDRLSGRDRRRLRAHRLSPLQRAVFGRDHAIQAARRRRSHRQQHAFEGHGGIHCCHCSIQFHRY